jgi:hypothetical protein
MEGLENVLNREWKMPVNTTKEKTKRTWKTLTLPVIWNPHESSREYRTLHEGERPAMPPEPGQTLPYIQGKKVDEGFKLFVPVAAFAKLEVVEREAIESLASIKNLLASYVREPQHHSKPVSIGVFGPPGTGKGFTVKQISKNIDPTNELIEIL